ncbi:hybrid sensor histidine kinase/response regulator, partial [Enterococcus hirae]
PPCESTAFVDSFPEQYQWQTVFQPVTRTAYRGRVLVAEDNANNRNLISLYLRQLGVQASFAENGREAVMMALRNDYDVVLMDMQMPVMDG